MLVEVIKSVGEAFVKVKHLLENRRGNVLIQRFQG